MSFLTTLGVVTFVMSIGIFFKITELAARGVQPGALLMILLYGMPQALSFSIPVSVLMSGLLVFGRLSADGEITAMRASGVSMAQIARQPLGMAFLASLICLGLNSYVQPKSYMARRQAIAKLDVMTPVEMLEEGRFIDDFAGMTIYVERRRGSEVRNVRIYDEREKGVRREIRAKSGRFIASVRKKGYIRMELDDVRIDPFSADTPGPAFCDHWVILIDATSRQKTYRPKEGDLTMVELWRAIQDPSRFAPHLKGEDLAQQASRCRVEFHRRFVMALACTGFMLLAIPLGVRTHRKESSFGVGLSLILVFLFYLFVALAESLGRRPEWRPELILWIPIAGAGVLGVWLLRRRD